MGNIIFKKEPIGERSTVKSATYLEKLSRSSPYWLFVTENLGSEIYHPGIFAVLSIPEHHLN